MGIRTYENFDIALESAGPDRYRARVTTGSGDDEAAVDLQVPFDDTTLENLLLKLDPGRATVRSAGPSPGSLAAERLGTGLYTALFTGDVAQSWARTRAESWATGRGIRLRLRFSGAPELAALPWELLRDPGQDTYLALSERTPVVRHLSVPAPLRPLAVDGPLRILAVLASPTDLALLDIEGEWSRLQAAVAEPVASGQIVLDRLAQPTLSELADWLQSHDVHILHVVAHGELDAGRGEGVVYLPDAAGRATACGIDVLGPFIRDHDSLRMVVLNACRSASGEPEDLFSGLAQGLVRQNVGAVVAMQFPITDAAACGFAGALYAALVTAQPVDQAVTAARKTMLVDHGVEWATPVLFLRASDGVVFEGLTAAPKAPVAQPQPVPEVSPAPLPLTLPSALALPVPVVGDDPIAARATAEPSAQSAAGGPSPGAGSGAVGGSPPIQATPSPVPPVPPRPLPPSPPAGHDPSGSTSRTPLVLVGGGLLLVLALIGGFVLFGRGGGDTPQPDPSPTLADEERWANPGAAVTIGRFDQAPDIDGDAVEWNGVPEYVSDNIVAARGTETEVVGFWQLGWDDEAFYFFVDVIDPVITQTHGDAPSQLWRGDSVSLELGPYRDVVRVDVLDPQDMHILIGPTQDGHVLRAVNIADGASLVTGPDWGDGQAAVRLTDHGYQVEAALPWHITPQEGMVFAGNLNVSDAVPDGPDRGDLMTMLSNNPWRTTNGASERHIWGTFTLGP